MKKQILFITMILLFTNLAIAENCSYKFFNKKNTSVSGTGFKYTNKTGVKAKFTDFNLLNKSSKSSVKELINNTKVSINLHSIDSGNTIRDTNLKKSLFKDLKNDSNVTIEVISHDEKIIYTNLNLNGSIVKVNFEYEIKDETLTATSTISATDFKLSNQLEMLQKLCHELHIGEDGISKTWTDFDLELVTEIVTHYGCD